MKALPHRLRDGRCRDCGQHDVSSAPDTCTRCELQRVTERGYRVVLDPIARVERYADETWRQVAVALRIGSLQSGRFYVFVGDNDGGPLRPPLGDLTPTQWAVPTATRADEIAQGMTHRYRSVWIVTSVGSWNVTEGAKP